MTRRVVKPQPQGYFEVNEAPIYIYDTSFNQGKIFSPYHQGDILYVRETWCKVGADVDKMYFDNEREMWDGMYLYKADGYDLSDIGKWHPSINMPKDAARLFLRVIDVRVEKLQDITEEQAKKEGAWTTENACPFSIKHALHPTASTHAIAAFAYLWDSIINKSEIDKYGWDANPYVWVYEFDVITKAEAMKEEVKNEENN